MPETVCVTLEQLREIEWVPAGDGMGYECAVCGGRKDCAEPRYIDRYGEGHRCDCWLANAIAQAERLKDWAPVEKDRVRLKAMPELEAVVAVEYNGEAVYIDVNGKRVMRQLAELIPEE